MGLRLKVCWDCGQRKKIGASKSRCKSCRHKNPHAVRPGAQKPPPSKKQPKIAKPEMYWERNLLLNELGYADYTAYRGSELYASIRKRGWTAHGNRCRLCGSKADVLHHLSYRKEVLLGKRIDQLVPLCNECHTEVEFDEYGNKRTLQEAVCAYHEMLTHAQVGPTR